MRGSQLLTQQMCVEASVFARHLYEQNGFRLTDNVEITVPQKWSDKPKVEFMFMRRPKASGAPKVASEESLNKA